MLGVYLYVGAGDVADLLDLGAALADERAALAGRHDQPQRDGRARPAAAALAELRAPLGAHTTHYLTAKYSNNMVF